jgi:hypothetical protein
MVIGCSEIGYDVVILTYKIHRSYRIRYQRNMILELHNIYELQNVQNWLFIISMLLTIHTALVLVFALETHFWIHKQKGNTHHY